MTLQEKIKEAQEMRDLYVDAQRVLMRGGKSYNIGGQSLTREDLASILNALKYWENELAKLSGGGMKIKRIIPVDD